MIQPILLVVMAQLVTASSPVCACDQRQPAPATVTASTIVAAADSIEVTNTHPHTMKIVMPGEKGETALGEVEAGATKKLPIVIPKGAKSIVLRAFSPENPGMEVSESVTIEAGKPLKWTVLVG